MNNSFLHLPVQKLIPPLYLEIMKKISNYLFTSLLNLV